jgi:Collagen triple helix repeat (20 copies)
VSLAQFTFTDRAVPIVQLGTGDTRTPVGQAVWDVSRWDEPSATWAGTEPTWHDITCETQSYQCAYGRQRSMDRFTVGLAQVIVDNSTGWADPNTVAGTNVLTVRPGRAIRMGVIHAVHGVHWLFRGFVDAVTPTYDPSDPDHVQLDCIDALGEVNRAKFVVTELAPAGETIDKRINRVLDLTEWSPLKRDVHPTGDTLIESDMSGQAADLLGQAAESGGGVVFGDLEANVAYRGLDWMTFPPGTPPDGTIGNVDPGDVCPTKWERPFARADITTRAIFGRGAPSTGVAGPPGPSGEVGPQGPQGPAGPKGDTGAAGATGAPGATGAQGPKGDTGATGAAGTPGAKGDPGATGATGATGAAGTPGATGAQGPKGDPGATGATGPASTVPGPAGPAGTTGAQGPKGDTGATGPQGPKGDTGATGTGTSTWK